MINKSDFDPELASRLEILNNIPARNIQKEEAGKTAFLQEALSYRTLITKPVTPRHTGWMHRFSQSYIRFRKEHSLMSTAIATILIITSLVFGAGGATVVAAQSSLPDEPLYGVKLWSEDVRLDFITDPTTDFQLALEFENRRAEEIVTLLNSGYVPSTDVLSKYQEQINQTIQYGLHLNDDQSMQGLALVRSRLVIQQQNILQVKNGSTTEALNTQLKLQQMIQERIQAVENGIVDPVMLREQLRSGGNGNYPSQTPPVKPGPANGQTSSPEKGGNPWTTGTPTPGSGYGPGAGTDDCVDCTPSGNGMGGNPYTTGTPTPGSGYGSGSDNPGQQSGNGNGYGQEIFPTLTETLSTSGKKGGNH